MKKLILIFWLFHALISFGQISVFTEDFENNSNFWREIENDTVRAKIENGVYSIESKSSKPLFFWNSNLPIDYKKDFRIDCKISSSEIQNQTIDFIYAGLDSENYASIRLLKGVFANHFGKINGVEFKHEAPFFIEKELPHFMDSISCFTMDKRGNNLFVFINNDFVSVFNFPEIKGSKIGFFLSNESKLEIQSIQIFQAEKQDWLSENLVEWNNPKSNLFISKKKQMELNYSIPDNNSIYESRLYLNNIVQESKRIELKRGLNFIELELKDSLNHTLSIEKIIRRGKVKKSKTSKAILFANDTFDEWENLNNPKNDVDSLKQTLEFIYGFDVEIIYNSAKEEILKKLAQMKSSNTQLFVYFAGHGALDSLGNAYWVCTDSKLKEDSGESFLSWNAIINALDSLNYNQKLLVTDVCFSGRIANLDTLRTSDCPYNNQMYIASGNEIISDGKKDYYSPFAVKFISDLSNYWVRGLPINNFNLNATFYLNPDVKFGNFGDACNEGNYIFVPK